MASCQNTSKTPAIDLANFDLSVAPNADFYEYATGGWQAKNPLKPEYSRYGSFDVLRDNNEKRINDMDPSKRNIGMVFQNYAIFPNLSVRDNVAFGLKNRKVDKTEIKKRTDEFLNLMQIMQYADRMPNQLSGGQQQRVSIARALARGPAVILADEPTGALDSHTSREVLGMLQDLHKQGNTVVLITHDNSIAVQAERIIRLEDGRVVYDGDAHAPEAVVQPNFMMAEPKAGEEGTQA